MSQTPTTLDGIVGLARAQSASDVHLEPGMPVAIRIRGSLKMLPQRLDGDALRRMAYELIGPAQWPEFVNRQSYDLSRTLSGVRCRINVLCSARGVGMAIRILASFQATLKKLNLHPDLAKLMAEDNGLVLVSGATGAGKSSTLAAMLQVVNSGSTRHIITIESPIEYALAPRNSFIRQREVGRDTPSFEQALIDALREDPDVLMVGEMREPQTMRLTLNAAETGHLVLSTLHSSTCAEALQRIVTAFAPEVQASVCAQLADALIAVICQRLTFRPDLGISVPELEILVATTPVRSIIRSGNLFKLSSALETGGQEGSFTFARYREWLSKRTDIYVPQASDQETQAADATVDHALPQATGRSGPEALLGGLQAAPSPAPATAAPVASARGAAVPTMGPPPRQANATVSAQLLPDIVMAPFAGVPAITGTPATAGMPVAAGMTAAPGAPATAGMLAAAGDPAAPGLPGTIRAPAAPPAASSDAALSASVLAALQTGSPPK
jgi:twitching motility protein PilT